MSASLESSAVSLMLSGGGGSAATSETSLTLPPQPSSGGVSVSQQQRKKTGGGRSKNTAATMPSPVRQQQELSVLNINNAHTPKPSRKKKGREDLKTPGRRYENSNPNFEDDSTKDLKEILFPDLFGAKASSPMKQKFPPTGPQGKRQTRSNTNNSNTNINFNGNINGNINGNMNGNMNGNITANGQMLSPQQSSPPFDCFAGSSFHNSPAPSALPKPSFKGVKTTSCALYSPSETFPPTTTTTTTSTASFVGRNNGFSNNDMYTNNSATTSETISLESDLKRILNVNQS